MNSSEKSNSRNRKYEKKQNKHEEDTEQKWFQREELQDLAKLGGDILKKTVATGKEVFQEVKDNFPKEASQFISKGRDELLKGISREMAGKMFISTIERLFDIACQHRLEFSVSLHKRKKEENRKEE